MMFDFKFKNVPHRVLNLLDARVAKLNHFSAVQTYQVVVLFVAIGSLIDGEVGSKLMLSHEIAGQQQLKGIVHRGPADTVVVHLHVDIQALSVKMVGIAIDLVEDGGPFRRFPQLMSFKMSMKHGSGFVEDFVGGLFLNVLLGMLGHVFQF